MSAQVESAGELFPCPAAVGEEGGRGTEIDTNESPPSLPTFLPHLTPLDTRDNGRDAAINAYGGEGNRDEGGEAEQGWWA